MTILPDDVALDACATTAPPTLASAGAVAPDVFGGAAAFAAEIRAVLSEMREAFAAAEPSIEDALFESEEAAKDLESAFRGRYQTSLPPIRPAKEVRYDSIPPWLAAVRHALSDLRGQRWPWFAGGRAEQQRVYGQRFEAILAQRPAAERGALRSAFAGFVPVAIERATDVFQAAVPRLQQILDGTPAPPPIVGWVGEGAMEDGGPVPGVGRPLLHVGFAVLGPLKVTVHDPGQSDGPRATPIEVPTGPFGLPLLLDLDRYGGLVTDRLTTVNNTLLRLLGLLPAGQVKATVFDPGRLGESASFLFGLGDATETVIGAKVRTTERELAEALLELEEHITFVTQKYLQGAYDSLTAYNLAAGEVAEPYRVLVLYDFPRGFVRASGEPDVEALERLRKIVEAGRRSGVFTLITTSPDQAQKPADAITALPWLWAGRELHPQWLHLLAVGDPRSTALTLDVDAPGVVDLLQAAREGRRVFTGRAAATWRYHADDPAADSTVAAILAQVERGLAQAQDVRVSASDVARLAQAKLERDVQRGTREPETLPLPGRPETWWGGSSIDAIAATFARVGAGDVGSLVLDSRTMSGAVIGGRPGSGKSVLLHALIASWTTRYSPEELELYLVDFKEGVEFKAYTAGALPHAKVVAIESEREFGLSVLQSLDAEITRRGTLFRDGSGEEVNLGAYRRRTGLALPRIVLVVDEFHVLFERDDKIASGSAELLDRIVRQGRAFGVHAILASQTLSGTAGLGRHTLNLLPIRIALQCSDADSRLLLADDNADARLLTRPGEGIINTSEGLREGNVRFQALYTAPEERSELVSQLRAKADAAGLLGRPVVFEGSAPARVEDLPEGVPGAVVAGATALSLPVGLPLTLAGPVYAQLRREPGGNLLLVGDEDAAVATLTVALAALARSAVATTVLDFGSLDGPMGGVLERLVACDVGVARRREVRVRLEELAALVEQRQALSDLRAAPTVCVLNAVHRARELDATLGSEESELLDTILRDGPDVGVHVVAWCDKPVSLGRRLSSTTLREFGVRLLGPMSRDDSFAMVDSDLASQIGPSQAVLDDHDRAATTRLRRFAAPAAGWLDSVLATA
jgi:hypothetical protein